ncbi:hypothetical protein EVAR_67687_1 [Eumeta japonica]|uniref:Uncharacterized protein n=1 Tax=Eumeta variegata TaxID=151549 RepID=A0A4C1ZIW2_EUMVA|nr:hypothetical protein EVAR_67687_1 [Eumeta japonica]
MSRRFVDSIAASKKDDRTRFCLARECAIHIHARIPVGGTTKMPCVACACGPTGVGRRVNTSSFYVPPSTIDPHPDTVLDFDLVPDSGQIIAQEYTDN